MAYRASIQDKRQQVMREAVRVALQRRHVDQAPRGWHAGAALMLAAALAGAVAPVPAQAAELPPASATDVAPRGAQALNEQYEPIPAELGIEFGVMPSAERVVANANKMPKGTKYEWVTPIDPSRASLDTFTVTVAVVYPDGSRDLVSALAAIRDDASLAWKKTSLSCRM